jgi:hypothetical protein
VLTTAGWLKLAVQIASNNLASLDDLFESAQSELRKLGISYHPSGKRDAVGELLTAKRE